MENAFRFSVLVFGLLQFVGTSASRAASCIDLSGKYECLGVSSTLTVTQRECAQVDLRYDYEVGAPYLESYILDDTLRILYEDANQLINASFKATATEIQGVEEIKSKATGQIQNATLRLYLDEQSDLIAETSLFGKSGTGRDIKKLVTVCNRLP